MGGCATKSREVHRREADVGMSLAPVESNESAIQQVVLQADKQISEFGGGTVDEAALDDQGNRRRSLSLLFKEDKEQKGSAEDEQLLLTVPEKQEELSKAESEADKNPEAKVLLKEEEIGLLVESSQAGDADNALKAGMLEDVHCAATLIEKDDASEEKEIVNQENKNESIEVKEIAKQAEVAPAPDVVKDPKQIETTGDTEMEKEKDLKDEKVEKKEIVTEEVWIDETTEKKETVKEEDREDASVKKKKAEKEEEQ